jgi:hypothetical protein
MTSGMTVMPLFRATLLDLARPYLVLAASAVNLVMISGATDGRRRDAMPAGVPVAERSAGHRPVLQRQVQLALSSAHGVR